MTPDTECLPATPAIAAPYRLQWEAAQHAWVLLYPEGMVRLNEPAAQVLRRCDGATTLDAMVTDLQRAYADADLRADVESFLAIAHGRGWIR